MAQDMLVGRVMAYKDDLGDPARDEPAMVQVTEVDEEGFVELAFDHRRERVYVRFSVGELMRMVALLAGAR